MKIVMLRRLVFISICVFALSTLCGSQAGQSNELKPAVAPITGEWQATATTDDGVVHVALHIVAAKDGSLSATLDAAEMGAMDVPVDDVVYKDSKLTYAIDAAPGTYEGAVNKDATEIIGTWSGSGKKTELNFKRAAALAAAKPVTPSDIDGTWTGALDTPPTKVHLVLSIANTADGLSAKLQSPDQSPAWIAATTVTRTGASFTFDVKPLGALFEGKIGADLNSIDGTFTQKGTPTPLVLTRVKEPAK
jgi:hypothetical protein